MDMIASRGLVPCVLCLKICCCFSLCIVVVVVDDDNVVVFQAEKLGRNKRPQYKCLCFFFFLVVTIDLLCKTMIHILKANKTQLLIYYLTLYLKHFDHCYQLKTKHEFMVAIFRPYFSAADRAVQIGQAVFSL